MDALEKGLIKDWKTVFDSLGVVCDAALLPRLSNITSSVDPDIASLPSNGLIIEKVPISVIPDKDDSSIESLINVTIGVGDEELNTIDLIKGVPVLEPLKGVLDQGELKLGGPNFDEKKNYMI